MLVWLASYPRSGNTFFRIYLREVFGIESYSVYPEKVGKNRLVRGTGEDEESEDKPRRGVPYDMKRFADYPVQHVVKTHHPPFDGRRAIYIIRDGCSAMASYYHFIRDVENRETSMARVIAGLETFGSWSDHVRAWDPKNRPDTLLLRFEEVVSDPVGHIPLISEFLDRPPVGDTVPTFEELHERAPKYFRKGRTDSSRREFAPEDLALIEALHGDVLEEFGYPRENDATLHAGASLRSVIAEMERKRMDLEGLLARQDEDFRRLRTTLAEVSQVLGTHEASSTPNRLAAAVGVVRLNELRNLQSKIADVSTIIGQYDEPAGRERAA